MGTSRPTHDVVERCDASRARAPRAGYFQAQRRVVLDRVERDDERDDAVVPTGDEPGVRRARDDRQGARVRVVRVERDRFAGKRLRHDCGELGIDRAGGEDAGAHDRLRRVESHRGASGDPDKRAFTYFVMTGGRMIYASALRLAVLKFLLSMSATADVLALASLEVDLSKVELGSTVTVKWRGKPVFIRRRTPAEIAKEESVDVASLRDPQADSERAPNQEWLVAVGVCTHLGCVPIANAGDYNGWFCPCHGSHYDASGRIRKGPAPENLEIPEYKFLDGDKML